MATLHAGDGDTADGDVPTTMLTAQMQVLNAAFAPLGFSFVVAGVDKFSNASVRAFTCVSGSASRAQSRAPRRASLCRGARSGAAALQISSTLLLSNLHARGRASCSRRHSSLLRPHVSAFLELQAGLYALN